MKTNIKMPVDLDKEDWKILQLAGILLLGLFIFLLFIYLPGRAKLNKQKAELKALESQIATITGGANRSGLAEAALRLRTDLAAFEKQYPPQTEVVLRDLTRSAGATGVLIKAINPTTAAVIDKVGSQAIGLPSYALSLMEVNLALSGTFYSLGNFLASLPGLAGTPAAVELNVRKTGSPSLLDADLKLNAFIVTPR